jgi:ATP-binding cassette subfamily C (CFTR/MRP) protein 1
MTGNSVDTKTDELIQKTLRKEFKGCTIFCVAHRLRTILDYDKIAVFETGRIREFDAPLALLERDSILKSMLAYGENGIQN